MMEDVPYLPPAHERRKGPIPEDSHENCLEAAIKLSATAFATGVGYGVVKLHWDPAFQGSEPYLRYISRYGGRVAMVGATFSTARCIYTSLLPNESHQEFAPTTLAGSTAGAAIGMFLRPKPTFPSIFAWGCLGATAAIAYTLNNGTLRGPLASLDKVQRQEFRRDMWKKRPPAQLVPLPDAEE